MALGTMNASQQIEILRANLLPPFDELDPIAQAYLREAWAQINPESEKRMQDAWEDRVSDRENEILLLLRAAQVGVDEGDERGEDTWARLVSGLTELVQHPIEFGDDGLFHVHLPDGWALTLWQLSMEIEFWNTSEEEPSFTEVPLRIAATILASPLVVAGNPLG